MILVISLTLALLFVLAGGNVLRSRPAVWYAGAGVLSVFVVIGTWSGFILTLPEPLQRYALPVLTQGGLAGALFMIVMYAAAVPDGSRYMRRIMPIRGELSIIACILTLGHNIAYGKKYFVSLFAGGDLRWNYKAAAVVSLVLIAVMLPLFVTSFKRIRRRMQPRRWKRLQRAAYGFYALLYVHILLLYLPKAKESFSALLNVILYSLVFLPYAVLRIRKALRKKHHPILARLPVAAGVLAAVLQGAYLVLPAAGTAEASVIYQDGKYKGSGIGYNGKLTVSVVIAEGKIDSVKVTAHVEDDPYFTRAKDGTIAAVLQKQSVNVDCVSGATSTSEALQDAIGSALQKAAEAAEAAEPRDTAETAG